MLINLNLICFRLIIDSDVGIYMKFPKDLISFDNFHQIAFGFGFWINAEFSKYTYASETSSNGFSFIDGTTFKFQVFNQFIKVIFPMKPTQRIYLI